MSSISFYSARGEITGITSASADTIEATKQNAPWPWVDGKHDPEAVYVKNGEALARPVQNTILDGHTLMHLPIPCIVRINESDYDCDDSTAELVLDQNTTYTVTVIAWPFIDREFTIENNP